MNLGEMADLVCEKVGKTDTASLALAKKFINRRHTMLHDSNLWRDTTALVTRYTAAKNITFPASIDRVLAVRASGTTRLDHTEVATIFATNPASFEDTGTPIQFYHAPPCGIDFTSDTGNPGEPTTGVINFFATNAADSGKQVVVRGDKLAGEVDETVTLSSTFLTQTVNSYLYPSRIEKPVTSYQIGVAHQNIDTTEYMAPADTYLQHCRIQVTPVPTDNTTYYCLCKTRAEQLTSDTDTPLIRGCEDALIAFAQSDMLERMRQYSKAGVKQQEGIAQKAKLEDMERNQSASSVRLIPFVDSYEDAFTTNFL